SLKAEGGSAEPSFDTKGLRWRLSLPCTAKPRTAETVEAARPAGVASAEAAAPGELAGNRFLTIEDEPLVTMEIADILTGAGAQSAGQAASAEQALARLRAGGIEAALLDGNLQGEMVDDIAAG